MGKLTAQDVETAKHDPAKARPIRVGDDDGLCLQIASGGSKSWLFRYMLRGRSREMGLGPAGEAPGRVSLEGARALAAEARALLRQGKDPIDARHAARARAGGGAGPANPPPAGGTKAAGAPLTKNRHVSPQSGPRSRGGPSARREKVGAFPQTGNGAGGLLKPLEASPSRSQGAVRLATPEPATGPGAGSVRLPHTAPGGGSRERGRQALRHLSLLQEEDFETAEAFFSVKGRVGMRRLAALRSPRPRGPANRAEHLVKSAATRQWQGELSDGAAAACIVAGLPPALDRHGKPEKDHVMVGRESWHKERLRSALKRGLRRHREAEARRRDLETRLEDDPNQGAVNHPDVSLKRFQAYRDQVRANAIAMFKGVQADTRRLSTALTKRFTEAYLANLAKLTDAVREQPGTSSLRGT